MPQGDYAEGGGVYIWSLYQIIVLAEHGRCRFIEQLQ